MDCNFRRFLLEGKKDFHIYFDDGRAGVSLSQHHNFHHCVYVTHGKLLHSQYGEEFTLQSGDCIFTPAGVEHGVQIFKDTSYFCLSFSQNVAESLFSHLPGLRRDFRNIPPVIKIPKNMDSRLCHCFSCLLEEQDYEEDAALYVAHHLTISALIMLLRNEVPTATQVIPYLESEAGQLEREIIRCIQHINANYDQPLTTTELARISACSESKFSKAFQQYTGKTVKAYIAELRIKEALHMIDTSNIPIHSIAKKVGYKDFSTFYRNFVQIVGVSPTRYKESTGFGAQSDNPQS